MRADPGDGAAGGYGGADGAQEGYGEVMEGGYGGKDGAEPLCEPGQTSVTKRDFRVNPNPIRVENDDVSLQAYGNGCGTSMVKVL